MSDRRQVPGENASAAWPALGGVGGVALTAAAVFLVSVPAPASPRSVGAPVATVTSVFAAPPPPIPPVASVERRADDCAPLVVTFGNGAANLPPEATAQLDALASWTVSHDGARLVVQGHADALGDDQENLALSKRRARVVADALERADVETRRITVQGLGSFMPLEGHPDDSPRNRRAEVFVRGARECPPATEEP